MCSVSGSVSPSSISGTWSCLARTNVWHVRLSTALPYLHQLPQTVVDVRNTIIILQICCHICAKVEVVEGSGPLRLHCTLLNNNQGAALAPEQSHTHCMQLAMRGCWQNISTMYRHWSSSVTSNCWWMFETSTNICIQHKYHRITLLSHCLVPVLLLSFWVKRQLVVHVPYSTVSA